MCGNYVRMAGQLNLADSVLPWCTVTMVSREQKLMAVMDFLLGSCYSSASIATPEN